MIVFPTLGGQPAINSLRILAFICYFLPEAKVEVKAIHADAGPAASFSAPPTSLEADVLHTLFGQRALNNASSPEIAP